MPQTWLHSNRRAIAAGFLVPAALVLAAVGLAIWLPGAWRWWSLLPLVVALITAWSLARLMRQPRLAYDNGELLVFLNGSFVPERLPIDVVECFFMGQAPSLLPQARPSDTPTRAQAIVIRIAESAAQWHQRPVRRELGQWCEGYITVRGTWSEPIRPALVEQLNQRLIEIQRERRQEKKS